MATCLRKGKEWVRYSWAGARVESWAGVRVESRAAAPWEFEHQLVAWYLR